MIWLIAKINKELCTVMYSSIFWIVKNPGTVSILNVIKQDLGSRHFQNLPPYFGNPCLWKSSLLTWLCHLVQEEACHKCVINASVLFPETWLYNPYGVAWDIIMADCIVCQMLSLDLAILPTYQVYLKDWNR